MKLKKNLIHTRFSLLEDHIHEQIASQVIRISTDIYVSKSNRMDVVDTELIRLKPF